MSTARTIMFSWLPACLEHSAIPTFLCCCSCAHEPCFSGQGWCEEQLGEGAGSGQSRSPRRAVPLHAAWKRDTLLSRAVGRSPRSRRRSRGRGSVRQRPRRIPQPRAGSVPPEQNQRVRGFQRVCGSASFWSTGCGRCCGCWSLRQMERQLG